MTVREAAQALDCSISFIYKLMRLGELAYERRGRRKLPIDTSVNEYRQRNTVLVSRPPPYRGPASSSTCRFKHLFQGKNPASGCGTTSGGGQS